MDIATISTIFTAETLITIFKLETFVGTGAVVTVCIYWIVRKFRNEFKNEMRK